MTTLCKGCGKPIVFAKDTEGKVHVLDPRPPVFGHIGDTPSGELIVRRIQGGFVSHFATCSHASEFSASQKRKNNDAH